MKFNKWILGLAAVGVMAFAVAAQAQEDAFNLVRVQNLINPTNAIFGGAQSVTNYVSDQTGYYGRGFILVNVNTNISGGGGATTFAVQVSPDQTNWVNLNNYALITAPTAISYTNSSYGGTNLIATDNFLLPFTLTYPTPYTAGFQTPYPAPVLFTNTAASVTVPTSGNYIIGFSLRDNPRYLQTIVTTASTKTNVVTATLLGFRYTTP